MGSTAKDGLIRLAIVLALAAVLGLGLWYFNTRGARGDLGRFQGEWQVAVPSGVRDDVLVADQKRVTIRVQGDRWTYITIGKETPYALTLRPNVNPKEIDLVQLDGDRPTPNALHGIYTIDGDRAKVMLSISNEPRPTTFDTPDGPPGLLLERVK